MLIKNLTLQNFRNYKNLSVEFSQGINLITGSNALGKTNILESISILSNLKSFRNVNDSEIIKWGESSYYCSLLIEEASLQTKFELGCSNVLNKIQKKAKIDGAVKKKLSDYYGHFLTVIFSPEDIELISGSPDLRRKYFDSIISKIDAAYLNCLTDFKKILTFRNRLLKNIREKKIKASGLDVWDDMFAEKASIILKKRIEFLHIFNLTFKDSSYYISANEDSPGIDYYSTIELNEKTDILNALLKYRDKDIILGLTGLGPHRDDYNFVYSKDRLVKNCASQGQKRTATISLKIAECKFIEQKKAKKAVILIDDIFGELDNNRRNKMMDFIQDSNQIIITAVNPDLVEYNKSYNIQKFMVLPGAIIKKS